MGSEAGADRNAPEPPRSWGEFFIAIGSNRSVRAEQGTALPVSGTAFDGFLQGIAILSARQSRLPQRPRAKTVTLEARAALYNLFNTSAAMNIGDPTGSARERTAGIVLYVAPDAVESHSWSLQ